MCTFVLAWRVFDGVPVAVAANRDERLDRPTRPPGVLDEDPLVVAPRDVEAGGTWIGYNEHGVVASVTNRWTDADLAGERSRGLLVRDALAEATAADAAAHVEAAVADAEYAGFNVVVADAASALLVEWDGDRRTTAFDPGVHVVVNVGADETFEVPGFGDAPADRRAELAAAARDQAANARRARGVLRPESGESAEAWLDRAADVLADHDFGFCVHRDGFGTRSSSLVTVDDGEVAFRHADGPPCESGVAYERIAVDADAAD